MARKKGVNKSQQVRDYMAEHPGEKPVDIAKTLGVPVTTVYNVRSKMSKAGGKKAPKKRGRPPKNGVTKQPGNESQLDGIRKAAELVQSRLQPADHTHDDWRDYQTNLATTVPLPPEPQGPKEWLHDGRDKSVDRTCTARTSQGRFRVN